MNDGLKKMLEYNRIFVEHEMYKKYETTKYPDRKICLCFLNAGIKCMHHHALCLTYLFPILCQDSGAIGQGFICSVSGIQETQQIGTHLWVCQVSCKPSTQEAEGGELRTFRRA